MKHPATRELLACWELHRRSLHPASARGAADAASHLRASMLGIIYTVDRRYRVQTAGARLRDMLGAALLGNSFPALFTMGSRRDIRRMLAITARERIVTVAGLRAKSGPRPIYLELLLLPGGGNDRLSVITGMLSIYDADDATHPTAPLGLLTLTSWRAVHLSHTASPRDVRKLSVAPGMTLYEGASNADHASVATGP